MNIKTNNFYDFIFILSYISAFPCIKEILVGYKNKDGFFKIIRRIYTKPFLLISCCGFIVALVLTSILLYKLLKWFFTG